MIDLMFYVQRGGVIVYVLLFLNIIGFSIMLWKFILFFYAKRKTKEYALIITKTLNNNNSKYSERLFRNVIEKKINFLDTGLNTVKIIASISPLLGLLGTVVGVLNSFDSIAKAGLGDPSVFSNGISIALITTVAGLLVAIPHYIGYNYLIGTLDNIEHKIEAEVIQSI